MNVSRVRAIVEKDWQELRRNRQVLAPVVLIPFLLGVLVPASMLMLLRAGGIEALPPALLDTLGAGSSGGAHTAALSELVAYLFTPLFLVIAAMIASITASPAIAGEKDRHTMEALLLTPVSVREVVTAKILATWIPATVASWGAAAVYMAVVVATTTGVPGVAWFATWQWLTVIIVGAPLTAFAVVAAITRVSMRAKSMQGAQAVSGLTVLPVAFTLFTDTRLILDAGPGTFAVVTAVALGVCAALYWWCVSSFDPERLVTGHPADKKPGLR